MKWFILFSSGDCAGETVFVTCESVGNPGGIHYKKCEVGERNNKIVDVKVIDVHSSSECEFFDDEPNESDGAVGAYGYKNKYLWVDNGCGADFEVCLQSKTDYYLYLVLVNAKTAFTAK